MNKYIKNHIIISSIIILLSIFTLLLSLFFTYNNLESEYSNIIKKNIDKTIISLNNDIEYYSDSIVSTGEILSVLIHKSLNTTPEHNLNLISNLFTKDISLNNLFYSMYFVDEASGNGINSKGIVPKKTMSSDLRERFWYKNSKESTLPIISDIYADVNDDNLCLTISYPIFRNDIFLGVLSNDIFFENISEYILNECDENYNYYIINGNDFLYYNDNDSSKNFRNMLVSEINNNSNYLSFKFNKNKILGYYKYSELLDSYVVFVLDKKLFQDKKQAIFYSYLLLCIFVCLVLLLSTNYFIHRSYSTNSSTGFYTKDKFLKDIKSSKNLSEYTYVLYIHASNKSDTKLEYNDTLHTKYMIKYSSILKSIFKNTGYLYNYNNDSFAVLFHNFDKEKISNLINDNMSDLSSYTINLKNTVINIEHYLSLININTSTIKSGNTKNSHLKLKLEQVIVSIQNSQKRFVEVDLESVLHEIYDQNEKLIVLKKALKEDRIIPFFQPILDIKTGDALKYEVLMRIKTKDKYLSPFPFILVAEKNNMIEDIDLRILKKALEYKNIIDKEDRLIFSFNLSGKVLTDNKYLLKLNSIIDSHNIKHENIILEITETESIKNLQNFISIMNQFKENNYKFSIDDFGTGYSSIDYLKNIPANNLKIDGSFIKDINDNEENLNLVKSMVNMAKAFNMKTIAEYVENEEILKTIDELGIDYAQGYHVGKPNNEIKL